MGKNAHASRLILLGATLVIGLYAWPGNATTITTSGGGNGSERCLVGAGAGTTCDAGGDYSNLKSIVALIAADDGGATFTRVTDAADELWSPLTGAAVEARARYAARDFTLEYLAGASGTAETFVLSAIAQSLRLNTGIPGGQNANGDLVNAGPQTFTPIAGLPSIFRWAIDESSGSDLWSSKASDNTDLLDHVVTFQLSGGNIPTAESRYVVGFENSSGLGDKDYQDYVFEFKQTYPVPVPEPATIALLSAGLVGIGVIRRRKTAKRAA